jgi:hypothetical protein
VALVDRDAIARARRRRDFQEALEEEREREAALREQIELVVGDEEGARIDRELLELLEPADAALLTDLFSTSTSTSTDDGDEVDWEEDAGDPGDEVARLSEEIEHSQARQRALERAAQLLGSPADAS